MGNWKKETYKCLKVLPNWFLHTQTDKAFKEVTLFSKKETLLIILCNMLGGWPLYVSCPNVKYDWKGNCITTHKVRNQ